MKDSKPTVNRNRHWSKRIPMENSFVVSCKATPRRRVLICKNGPAAAMEQAMMRSGQGARIETVPTLAAALEACLENRIDSLVVNMFSITSSELTALMLFREIRPDQEVITFSSEEMALMFSAAGLADESYAVPIPARTTGHSSSVRR